MELTINPIRKMIKKAGAKRVSDDAAEELGRIMEERAIEICKRAQKLAELSKRSTVLRKDIKAAAKDFE